MGESQPTFGFALTYDPLRLPEPERMDAISSSYGGGS